MKIIHAKLAVIMSMIIVMQTVIPVSASESVLDSYDDVGIASIEELNEAGVLESEEKVVEDPYTITDVSSEDTITPDTASENCVVRLLADEKDSITIKLGDSCKLIWNVDNNHTLDTPVEVYEDEKSLGSIRTGSTDGKATYTPKTVGTHRLYITGNDIDGNDWKSNIVTVIVKDPSEYCEVQLLANERVTTTIKLGESCTLKWDVDRNHTLSTSVVLYEDSKSLGSVGTDSTGGSANYTPQSVGTHELHIAGYDQNNYYWESNMITVVVRDDSTEYCDVRLLADGRETSTITLGHKSTLKWKVESEHTIDSSVDVYEDNKLIGTTSTGSTGGSAVYTPKKAGTHRLYITGYDTDGNYWESNMVTVIVEPDPARVNLSDFINYITIGNTLQFKATIPAGVGGSGSTIKWYTVSGSDYFDGYETNGTYSSTSRWTQTVKIRTKGSLDAGKTADIILKCSIDGIDATIDSDTDTEKKITLYSKPSCSYNPNDRSISFTVPRMINSGTSSSSSSGTTISNVRGVRIEVFQDGVSLGSTIDNTRALLPESDTSVTSGIVSTSIVETLINSLNNQQKIKSEGNLTFRLYPCNDSGTYNNNIYSETTAHVYRAVITWTDEAGNACSIAIYGLEGQTIDAATVENIATSLRGKNLKFKDANGKITTSFKMGTYPAVNDHKLVFDGKPEQEDISVRLVVGGKITNTAIAKTKDDGTQYKISVANSQIASVSNTGVIQGKKAGNTTATITKKGKTYKLNITVVSAGFTAKNYKMNTGETITKEFATGGFAISSALSSKPEIAAVSVTSDGLAIAAKKKGSTQISTIIQGKKFTATVNVYDPVLSGGDTVLYVNKTMSLSVKNGNGKTEWSVDNKAVATINNGKVKGISKGVVTVTARNNGRIMTRRIIVCNMPGFIRKSYTVNTGDTIKPIFNSEGLAITSFASNKPDIASVYQAEDGLYVVANKKGSAQISAVVQGKKYTTSVKVYDPVLTGGDTLLLDKKAITLSVKNGNGKTAWSSNNIAVATVNNGKVKGVSKGTATITANNNGRVMTKVIKVYNVPYFDKKTYETKVGIPVNVVFVRDSDMGTPAYSVSNTKVATIDPNGKVTPIKNGTVTVTAAIGGKKYKTKVKITK